MKKIVVALLFCASAYLGAAEPPDQQNVGQHVTTTATRTMGAVALVATQTRPVSAAQWFCEASIVVHLNDKRVDSVTFNEIEPVGSSYGLLVPSRQPVKDHLVAFKLGDYDGRLLLVDRIGTITNLKGGPELVVDNTSELLFTVYASDQPAIVVYDLAMRMVVLEAEIPHFREWLTDGVDYYFLGETEVADNSKRSATAVRVDARGQSASTITMTADQLGQLRVVDRPLQREVSNLRNCGFGGREAMPDQRARNAADGKQDPAVCNAQAHGAFDAPDSFWREFFETCPPEQIGTVNGEPLYRYRTDIRPVPIEPVKPAMPPAARLEKAVVGIDIVVASSGTVVEARLSQSSGAMIVDDAALTAVRQWRFHPGVWKGKALAVRMNMFVELER